MLVERAERESPVKLAWNERLEVEEGEVGDGRGLVLVGEAQQS